MDRATRRPAYVALDLINDDERDLVLAFERDSGVCVMLVSVTEDLGSWFVDDADAGEARKLGRAAFVDKVISGIAACNGRKSSTVLSLVGSWGSGKSSIIDAVVAELEGRQSGWKVVRFNPWVYQDLASLQAGFFAELKQAFPKDTKVSNAREKVADFATAIAPAGAVVGLAGFDASGVAMGAAKIIGGDRSASGAQRLLEKVLGKRKTPVLVIMDDLDRLAPDELLLTFKLVRLIGRLPYVHYLLAYDEDTLLDALSRTGLVGKSKPRARDYLEKVVQVRFDVPALRPDDIRRMTTQSLNRALTELGLDMGPEEISRFRHAYFAHIESRLATPRSVRRYWAQVRLSLAELGGELDISDFLLLTWLRTAEPGAYRLIQERRGLMLGTARVSTNQSEGQKGRARTELRRALRESGTRPTHLEGVAKVLGQLFPNFRAAWQAKDRVVGVATQMRVSNPDYFDRYFTLGVPEGDIPDATVRAAVEQIVAGSRGPAETLLTTMLMERPGLALAKLSPLVDTQPPGPVIEWLGQRYLDIPEESSMFTPREHAIGIAVDLLKRLKPEEVVAWLKPALATPSGIPLTVQSVSGAVHVSDEDLPGTSHLTLDDAAREAIGAIFENAYRDLQADDPFAIEPDIWSSIWSWATVHKPSLKRWITDRQRAWGSLNLVARFVTTSRILGGPSETRLGDIDFSLLAELVDLPAIENELAPEIDAIELPGGQSRSMTSTPDNRRLTALRHLKARRKMHVAFEGETGTTEGETRPDD